MEVEARRLVSLIDEGGAVSPLKKQTIADVNVRAHTFKFISPAATERSKIPNACTGCHADKSNAWAGGELKKWPGISPWRIE